MSKITFSDEGWEDYLYWQSEDKKTLKKINRLIKDININKNKIYKKENKYSFMFSSKRKIWKIIIHKIKNLLC